MSETHNDIAGPIPDALLDRYVSGELDGDALERLEEQILADPEAFKQAQVAIALKEGVCAVMDSEAAGSGDSNVHPLPLANAPGAEQAPAAAAAEPASRAPLYGALAASTLLAVGLYTWVDLGAPSVTDNDRTLYLLTVRSGNERDRNTYEFSGAPPERFTLVVDLIPGMEDGVSVTLVDPSRNTTEFPNLPVDDYQVQFDVVLTEPGRYDIVARSLPESGAPVVDKPHRFDMVVKADAELSTD